jgi:pantothenate kinase type III
VVAEDGEFLGGEIIPGFRLPLAELFAEPGGE